MGTISKNFSYREFEKSPIADRKGYCNVITSSQVRDAVKALTLNVLQPLRDAMGFAIQISSGYRCPELNSDPEVGGSETSQHPKGEAADIHAYHPDGSEVPSIYVALCIKALELPFDQLIIYPSFVHVSHKLAGKQRGQILYNRSYTGPTL